MDKHQRIRDILMATKKRKSNEELEEQYFKLLKNREAIEDQRIGQEVDRILIGVAKLLEDKVGEPTPYETKESYEDRKNSFHAKHGLFATLDITKQKEE